MSQNKNDEVKRNVLSRRNFGQKAGLAGVAAIFSVSRTNAAPAQENSSHTPDNIRSAELDLKYQRAMLHYGDRLSAEQKTRVRKILESNEKMMELIREFHLENGQGTATTLKLFPDPAVLLEENPNNHVRKN